VLVKKLLAPKKSNPNWGKNGGDCHDRNPENSPLPNKSTSETGQPRIAPVSFVFDPKRKTDKKKPVFTEKKAKRKKKQTTQKDQGPTPTGKKKKNSDFR